MESQFIMPDRQFSTFELSFDTIFGDDIID